MARGVGLGGDPRCLRVQGEAPFAQKQLNNPEKIDKAQEELKGTPAEPTSHESTTHGAPTADTHPEATAHGAPTADKHTQDAADPRADKRVMTTIVWARKSPLAIMSREPRCPTLSKKCACTTTPA